MSQTIYLAGPDVFRRDAIEIGKAKQTLCTEQGFIGLFPLDNTLNLDGLTAYQQGLAIYDANIELMKESDFIIANMTPFRGPGMDQGTAFEMGYLTALKKPIYAYTLNPEHYAGRISHKNGWDSNGLQVESFEMADNLMLVGAIEKSGGQLISHLGDDSNTQDHLDAFSKVLECISNTQ